LYFSEDVKKHKQQLEDIRLFARELGRIPGGKTQGVGIPSFSIATKGQIKLNKVEDRVLGKKIERFQEEKHPFSLDEELNHRKIKDTSQRFILGLMSKEDFSLYLDRVINIIEQEIGRFQKRSVGDRMSDWKEELLNKNVFTQTVENYKNAIKEFRFYLENNREKHIAAALRFLSLAHQLIEDNEESKAFAEEVTEKSDSEIKTDLSSGYSTKKLDIINIKEEDIADSSSYSTRKQSFKESEREVLKSDLSSGFTTKKLTLPDTKLSEPDKKIPLKDVVTPPAVLMEKQPYIMAGHAPSWHSHYKSEREVIKGYDLAYVSSLFKNLTFSQLDDIANKMSIEKPMRGSMLFKERQEGDKVYIIKSGKVLTFKSVPISNLEKEVLTFSAGDILGDISCIDGGSYAFSARIYSEGTVLISIQKSAFREFLIKYPWLSQNLNILSSLRLRDLYNKLTT